MQNTEDLPKVTNNFIKENINNETVFQVGEDGQCILWTSEDNIFCSNNFLSEFEFRSHRNIDSLIEVDFYNLREEEIDYILSKYEFRQGY